MHLIKTLNNRYLLFSALLYIILAFRLDSNFLTIYLLGVLSFLLYYFVLQSQLFKRESFYSSKRLLWLIFTIELLFITANNAISYLFNHNYFVFSEVDAGTYHVESLLMSSKPFKEAIDYFLTYYTFEDLGAVLTISTLYRLVESNLIVNAFYLLLSLLSGLGMFKIGRYLMPVKYAYMSALAFSISSFFIWFNSSGLKESVMIFLVIQSFLHYYHFINRRKLKYIISMIVFLLSLMLFRPAVVFLILGSILIGHLLKRKKSFIEMISIIILVGGLVFGSPFLDSIINKFIGDGVSQMIETKEASGMVQGSVGFTYLVNMMAGLIGPLPTILPNDKTVLSFFAPGLIYKTLISIPFWFGMYYIYKRKLYLCYPIALFALFEAASLVVILEGLELRKSLPHFPFIYIISFGFLSLFETGYLLKRKSQGINRYFLDISFVVIFLLMLFWNFRF